MLLQLDKYSDRIKESRDIGIVWRFDHQSKVDGDSSLLGAQ